MAKLSLIFNLVLAVAVGILFYLYTSIGNTAIQPTAETAQADQSDSTVTQSPKATKSALEARIVYVQSDSILSNYKYFDEIEKLVIQEEGVLRKRLERQARSLEQEFRLAEEKVTAGVLSEKRVREIENELAQKREKLFQDRESLSIEMAEFTEKMNIKARRRIAKYLKTFNEERQYDFVLGYQGLGGVMHADSSLDITAEVVAGLNADYDAWKSEAQSTGK